MKAVVFAGSAAISLDVGMAAARNLTPEEAFFAQQNQAAPVPATRTLVAQAR